MKNLKLITLIFAFGGAVLGQAQTAPPAINYQGRLTQATGVVVPDGLTGMRVRIFATASGGSALWDSGDLSVATKSGTFSILLGSGGMPAMAPAVFALGSVYIEVQPTGQAPLLPRQPIATVPWAFYAQTVSDGAITTSKLGNEQVTVEKLANLSVSTEKVANGSITSAKLANDINSLTKVSSGKLSLSGDGASLLAPVSYIGLGSGVAPSYVDILGNPSVLRVRGNNPSLEINRVGYGNAWVWTQSNAIGGASDDLKLARYRGDTGYAGIPLQVNLLNGFVSLNEASAYDPLTIRTAAPTGGYEQGFALRNYAQTQTFRFGIFNNGLDIAAEPHSNPNPAVWIGANGRVGLGTNSPVSPLQISDGGNVGGAGGEVSFSAYAGPPMASIKSSLVFGSTEQVGHLDFKTRPGVGSPLTTRMRIQSDGTVQVFTNLVKPAGTFQIDHPLDPYNKTLSHSFVESPDMMNIYNGNVTTDGKGEAWVKLPDYFESLNIDFRYQLTVIGEFAQAIIGKKVKDNRFLIRTSKPRCEVSWQVTGVRNDSYARKHRVIVEQDKRPEDKGRLLYENPTR